MSFAANAHEVALQMGATQQTVRHAVLRGD